MDFARKQLEKYGWTDGKGLGKHENGISEALKTKMKRSVTGLGHDVAADFTEHWWTTLYDKAAENIKVKDKNGQTKKIKTETNNFEITNSEWKLKRKKKDERSEEEYSSFFVKKAILSNGGSKTEQFGESDPEDEALEKKDVLRLTDEELFAACGGRTAHKGARHGLKALGKLARIEQQEKLLLNDKRFDGYSHKKKKQTLDIQEVEDMNLNSDVDVSEKKHKKNKKKHCSQENFEAECDESQGAKKIKKKRKLAGNQDDMKYGKCEVSEKVKQKKSKKNKNVEESTEIQNSEEAEVQEQISKKKKRNKMSE